MTELMLQKLRDAQEKQYLVSLSFDPGDDSETVVGYVNSVTDSYVRLKSVNMYGEDDGWEVLLLASLYMVRSKGIYERKIEYMKTQIKTMLFEETPFVNDKQENLMLSTLRQAKDKNVIVRLYSRGGEELARGFVNEVVADTIALDVVDSYGVFADGIGVIKFEEIDRLHCNSKEDKALVKWLSDFK